MSGGGFSTGRIEKALTPTARRILFQGVLRDQIDHDLRYMCEIDFAHVLMLVERGIVSKDKGKRLLETILQLIAQDFAQLHNRSSVRGLFLLYERYLIETAGPEVGGVLQTGRSRNDLNATLLKMRLRRPYVDVMRSLLRLQAILLLRARRYAKIVMPAYTHGQAAEPITFGHYLAGIAQALTRDIEAIADSLRQIHTCPLGAGAVAGTALPIDCQRTAELLGFTGCTGNSIDAVASRDLVFRVLAALAICGATLSRVATDLLQWSTAEFQFLSLPDELIGSSSAMPQKRNPFLLEHVQGRTASALGAFVTAVSAARNTAFTNSIAVGTEAVRPVWGAIKDLTEAATLLRLVLSGVQCNPGPMLRRAVEGFTSATALANCMVVRQGSDFRSAHHKVGALISEALRNGMTSMDDFVATEPACLGIDLAGLDPASCVERAQFGGGPSQISLDACCDQLRDQWARQWQALNQMRTQWAAAHQNLEQAVKRLCDTQKQ